MERYYIYVLRSLKNGIQYCGLTNSLERRLAEHNAGHSKFTKGHIPWEMVYFEEAGSLKEARLREKYYKSGVGREELKMKLDL